MKLSLEFLAGRLITVPNRCLRPATIASSISPSGQLVVAADIPVTRRSPSSANDSLVKAFASTRPAGDDNSADPGIAGNPWEVIETVVAAFVSTKRIYQPPASI